MCGKIIKIIIKNLDVWDTAVVVILKIKVYLIMNNINIKI